jgi:drug/metabolite transporter (DMT)-like permease
MMYVKLVLTAVFWGGTFIAGRQVSRNLGPFSLAFLRFAVASAFLLGLTRIREGRLTLPGRGQIIPVILLGMTGVFGYNVFFFKGLRLIEAGRAALIVATCPAFIAVTSAVLLKERFSINKIIGVPLSVLGAIVVISQGRLDQLVTGGVGLGELFILGCVLSWVAYSLIGKVAMQHLSPLASVAYSSLIGAAALFVPAIFYDDLASDLHQASLIDWTSIVYLAVCGTVIGFVWYYEGVKAIGPTRAGLFINFVPISAVILAGVILHEQITWSLAAGAALVLSGVYLTNRVDARGRR